MHMCVCHAKKNILSKTVAKKLVDDQYQYSEMIQSRCTVNIGQLNEELKNHPDRSYVTYLINGFTNGFDTGFTRLPELSFECKNLLSARRYPISTSELIKSELNKGFLIGLFDSIHFSEYRINPVGIAIGKYSSKKRHIFS